MEKRVRNRGIKASREKLEIAMLNAGIKTQTSLADKIAKRENLSSPPKDTINRVFREEFVSPTTITRIAKILSVEPHSLYLSQQQPDKTNTSEPDTRNKSKPLLGKFSLAINPITPEITPLSNSIHQLLKAHVKSTVLNPSLLPDQYMSVDIAQKYKADGVLTIRSHAIGRYQSIQVFYFLSPFQPDRFPVDYLQEIASQLPELINLELNPGAYAKLAHLLYLQGNYSQSKKALEKATQICPVFFQHPDLKPIIQELGFSPQFVAEFEMS